MTAGIFQPVMHFWNVVLSYVRKQNDEKYERTNTNEIELGENMTPNPVNTSIVKERENVRTKKVPIANPKHSNAAHHSQRQKPIQTDQQQRIDSNSSTRYYQTPTDQKNYHML